MYETLEEGKISINVDREEIVTRDLDVFYNPKMKLNRGLSVLLLNTFPKDDMKICLPLAGTGVRAIRILKEVDAKKISHIFLNDYNKSAEKIFLENLKLNKLNDEKITFTCQDARNLMTENRGYNYIDIDPFGSPNFLLDPCIQKIGKNGVFVISATDTGALAGTYPNAGKRKYLADTLICPQKHEIGLRILIRKAQMVAMQYDKALIPVLTYHYEHYYRIFFKIEKSCDKSAKLFDMHKVYNYCRKCGNQGVEMHECCGEKTEKAGPLYVGPIQDDSVITTMLERAKKDADIYKEEIKLLTRLSNELNDVVGFFDIHDLCKRGNGLNLVAFDTISEKLNEQGFRTAKPHTNLHAIQTDAPIKAIQELLK